MAGDSVFLLQYRNRVHVNDDIGTWKGLTDPGLSQIRQIMGLHQRQGVIQFEMKLDKPQRARLTGAQVVDTMYPGDRSCQRDDLLPLLIRQLPIQQDLETWNDFWSEYKGS